MIGDIHYLALFVVCVYIRYVATLSQRYTLRRDDYRIIDEHASFEVDCSSLISCTAVCNQHYACLTVSYKEAEGRCITSTTGVTHSFEADNLLVSESGWVTISKAVYKVFMVFNPLNNYQGTFADAVTLCGEFQTVIASPADLLESRALGLDMCRCGWLSDGTSGFVIQKASKLCWPNFNTNILYCNSPRINAWCRL